MPDLTDRPPRPAPLLSRYAAVLLCVVWLLTGVIGHEPWKPEDALHLGVAFGMSGGDWLVPRIAGDPWLISPPLYHWVAALCGKLLGWLLPWHDAARLASSLFTAAFLAILWRVAQRQMAPSPALAAPLLAIGTLGLLVPLHEAQPATVALTGFAVSLWGLQVWRDKPLHGGAMFGAGVGIGFLGTGVDSVAIQLATGLLLMLHPAWRVRVTLRAWLVAAAVALLLIVPWPFLLWRQSPALFDIWWAVEQASLTTRDGFNRHHLELIAWASWPVLPLAMWSVWLERANLLKAENVLLLTATACALFMYFTGTSTRSIALFPALVPLTLLAASAASRLRRGAANAFDWFGMMTFTLAVALVWLAGIAIRTGEPARIARSLDRIAPGFIAEPSMVPLLVATVVSLGWIAVMLLTPRSPWRAAARWCIGLSTLWVLVALLLLPWIDYGKSYRSISADFRRALGNQPGCIQRQGLGLAQRASLDYYNGIRTVGGNAGNCRYLIVQTGPRSDKDLPGWTLIREASRPGDKSEQLRLYRRSK